VQPAAAPSRTTFFTLPPYPSAPHRWSPHARSGTRFDGRPRLLRDLDDDPRLAQRHAVQRRLGFQRRRAAGDLRARPRRAWRHRCYLLWLAAGYDSRSFFRLFGLDFD
jgi:hypothetical protein